MECTDACSSTLKHRFTPGKIECRHIVDFCTALPCQTFYTTPKPIVIWQARVLACVGYCHKICKTHYASIRLKCGYKNICPLFIRLGSGLYTIERFNTPVSAFFFIQQRSKYRRTIQGRRRQPIYRTALAHKSCRAHVADGCVITKGNLHTMYDDIILCNHMANWNFSTCLVIHVFPVGYCGAANVLQ
jgi:hypothetical protein